MATITLAVIRHLISNKEFHFFRKIRLDILALRKFEKQNKTDLQGNGTSGCAGSSVFSLLADVISTSNVFSKAACICNAPASLVVYSVVGVAPTYVFLCVLSLLCVVL